MKYTIYKITNMVNNKIYIGKHQTESINDCYYGSGIAIKEAIKKYGKDNFKKEILFVFDNEKSMNDKEIELIDESFVKRRDTYNIGIGGEGGSHFKGHNHTDETKLKLSIAGKGRIVSKETRDKIGNIHRGKIVSEETRKKMSDSYDKSKHTGNLLSEETKAKLSIAGKGRIVSEETRKKISDSMKCTGRKGKKLNFMWMYSYKEQKSKMIPFNEINKYLELNWIKGRKIFK